MDFTINQYTLLLQSFKQANFNFQTFAQQGFNKGGQKLIILRHDVDLLPQNALQFARIQADLSIKGSYYFRIVPESFNEKIILEIAPLGHEIGYHYETMDTSGEKEKGKRKKEKVEVKRRSRKAEENGGKENQNEKLIDLAYEEFCKNLETFRKLVPIKTICMHGSPRSPYDNREIWKKYNYRDLGITGEPYFDTDFSKVAYYTDTGRMWDGNKYIVRDRIPNSQFSPSLFPFSFFLFPSPFSPFPSPFPSYHTTRQIIHAVNTNTFPEKAMLTFHPQRWTDRPVPWMQELVVQGVKNIVKKWFFVKTLWKIISKENL